MKKIYTLLLSGFFMLTSLTAQRLAYVQGEVLVKLDKELDVRKWMAKHSEFNQRPTKLAFRDVVAAEPMNIFAFTFDFTQINEIDFLAHLRKDPVVEAAQFNHFLRERSTIPNDPLFNQQWQYINTGQSGGTPGADFDIDLAWDLATGGVTLQGDTIVVCVIDDGLQLNHNDFGANIWVNKFEVPNNGMDDDANGFVDDFQGWNTSSDDDNIGVDGSHGTPVAGIIGALGDNALGVSGVNWNVKLMIVRSESALESEILEAYSYPLAQRMRYNETNGVEGAFVVATNASWGVELLMPEDAPLWCAFYDTLGTHGILNCGATSNDEIDVDVLGDLPSNCPSDYLIVVTNVDHNDEKYEAGFGATSVDLGAFGEDVFTTALGNDYEPFGGTSAATPHVAGAIGLLYSLPCPAFISLAKENPSEAALFIREVILEGVDDNESLDGITVTGGRLNIFNSMLLLNQNCGACVEPLNVNISNLTDVSANLNWVISDSINSVDLRWRNIGAIEWTNEENVESPFELSNLTPCTGYEFQLKTYCTQDTIDYTESFTFKTDGCCVPPTQVDFFQTNSSGPVLASWESILAAESYNIRIREGALGDWSTFSTTEPQFVFEGLMACNNYQVQVQTVCENMTTDFGPTQFLLTLGCGSCLEVMYCEPNLNNTEEEWIATVSLNTLNNETTSDNGYGDYTSLPATSLTTGESYTIELAPGFSGTAFSEYFKVWIDYDQDGIFDDAEVVFDAGMASTEAVQGDFEVPVAAEPGLTRMRVVMQFNTAGGPCSLSGLGFGEMEDYCVEIMPGEFGECTTPMSLDTSSVSTMTANLQWEEVAGAINFLVRYRASGQEIWTILTAASNEFELQGLSFCTEYEAQVRSVCNDGGSVYSPSFIFSTSCSTATEEQEEISTVNIFPNPFSEQVNINFSLEESIAELRLQLFTVQGQLVLEKHISDLPAGNYSETLDVLFPAGVYYVKFSSNSGAELTRKVVKSGN
jgi:hypothetical protein